MGANEESSRFRLFSSPCFLQIVDATDSKRNLRSGLSSSFQSKEMKKDGWGIFCWLGCWGNTLLLQAGGVSVIVGLVPSTEKVSFHPEELLFGRTWTSGLFGGFKGRTDLPLLVEKFLDGVSSKSLSDTSNQSKLKLYIMICALWTIELDKKELLFDW